MRWGFTGTRSVPSHATEAIENFVHALCEDDDEFTTGACVGVDSLIARYLMEAFPLGWHRLVVPANRTQVDMALVRMFVQRMLDPKSGGHFTVEFMPDGTTYKQRNERIIFHADQLIGVPGHPEHDGKSVRSGTWQTIRLARKAGFSPHLLTLSELSGAPC